MAIIAGIDEAGFGPVMGPLVVSATVFRVPDEAAHACLWEMLAGAVARKPGKRSPALPVADSKQMHVRTEGLVHLERGVLGMLQQGGPPPCSLRDLLRRVAPQSLDEMRLYPWYVGADLPLPRQADASDLALRAAAVRSAMERRDIVLEAVRAEPVLVGQYNRLLAATRNKSVVLWGVTSRLIAHVFGACARPGQQVRIIADRQGGRMRYREALHRMFEGARIKILAETPQKSAYEVHVGDRSAEIAFHVEGEAVALPCALASMVSKYLRELFMELENDWWVARVPGLKRTAGYYKDGSRFLRDIAAAIAGEGVAQSLIVRER